MWAPNQHGGLKAKQCLPSLSELWPVKNPIVQGHILEGTDSQEDQGDCSQSPLCFTPSDSVRLARELEAPPLPASLGTGRWDCSVHYHAWLSVLF